MITEYHRPQTIEAALVLLSRENPLTIPLAGGTAINRASEQPTAVVDLQLLGLNLLTWRGNFVDIGAMASLQALLESKLPEALLKATKLEATYNLRQMATAGGTLVAADGRSPFTTVLLALDASVTMLPGGDTAGLGDIMPFRSEKLRGRLITQVTLPTRINLAYEYIARTPADLPIVCAGLAIWPSGRVRLALGGFGSAPTLAFDGCEANGLEAAARSAYAQAGDEWASAEYRQEMAGVLARRCLGQLNKSE